MGRNYFKVSGPVEFANPPLIGNAQKRDYQVSNYSKMSTRPIIVLLVYCFYKAIQVRTVNCIFALNIDIGFTNVAKSQNWAKRAMPLIPNKFL